ncbi:MAG: hypothetical protein HZA93_08785 [Verrucomicrobia bacterium]|nr:hypothetical protein [Verrucomicrobiota bacterium]
MKKKKPRRGGWSGGAVPDPDYRFVLWCVVLGLTAVATATYLIQRA